MYDASTGGDLQYLQRTQWYYDKFEVYHLLNLRIASFNDELLSLHQVQPLFETLPLTSPRLSIKQLALGPLI